ncbi:glycosyltransferase [Methyloprofundus sp.]|uniref:glycosyltransferase n=1 Tax=Methyloprofundus sp. TaxID=2020875 RepID=UPI003D11628A
MSQTNKALIITDKKWRSGEKWFAFKLAKALRNKGWTVHFITAKEGHPRESAIAGNYSLWESLDPRTENPFTFLNSFFLFNKQIKQEQISHVFSFCGIGHIWMASCSNVKKIQIRMEARPSKKHFFSKILYQKQCDLVILPNEKAIEDQKQGAGLPPKGYHKTVGFINLEKFNPKISKAKDLISTANILTIGLVGRITKVKGHAIAIQAIKILNDKGIKCRLVCVGEESGITEQELNTLAEQNNCREQLIFTGRREDVPAIMQVCDIGIIPSLDSEYTVRTSLEWLSSGKPIVTSNVGSLAEITEPGYGESIPPKAPELLADAIEKISSQHKEMGLKARKKAVSYFSEELFYRQLESQLERLE